ncbi:MAG TPA: response regulator transcription factor [Gemmatimonadaceae bacterium]
MRILFVEDDRQLRTSVARGLREAGYTVDLATTGPQALSMVAAEPYDAIVLDILLPGLDGIAVCRALREQGNRVPILMLTALDAVEHRIRGLDAGADDYLAKPFDFGELLARLRALLRRFAEPVTDELRVGDLVIDLARHRVSRNAREIPLTAKEFAFLVYLARHAGRVVTRADLLAHVWDDTRTSYSNIIDVYASRVRRKIDEGEEVPLFRTARGIGYVLEAPEPSRVASRGAARGARRRS